MSHDRGCPCGRERDEYDICPEEKCFKKKKCDVVFDFHSPHNNEYWYKCNTCGATDWFAYYHRNEIKRDEPLKDCKMEDTDWRPSPCPLCGEMREASKNPICKNLRCQTKKYAETSNEMERTMKTQKRYLWIRPNSIESPMSIIDDPVELWRGNKFDETVDQLFEIGPEVKLQVSLTPLSSYRTNGSAKQVKDPSIQKYLYDNNGNEIDELGRQ